MLGGGWGENVFFGGVKRTETHNFILEIGRTHAIVFIDMAFDDSPRRFLIREAGREYERESIARERVR